MAVSRLDQRATAAQFPQSENSGELTVSWRLEKTSNVYLIQHIDL